MAFDEQFFEQLQGEIYDRMANDSRLQDLLGEWQSDPAIYMKGPPVPDEMGEPYIDSPPFTAASGATPWDTKQKAARSFERNIRYFDSRGSDEVVLQRIGGRIIDLWHKNPLSSTIRGYKNVTARIGGPSNQPVEDPQLQGRTITLSLQFAET